MTGTATLTVSDPSAADVAVSAVVPARTISFASWDYNISGNSELDHAYVTSVITSATNIRFMRRAVTTNTNNIIWFAVEFPPIKVTSPNTGSEVWEIGSTQTITWQNADDVASGAITINASARPARGAILTFPTTILRSRAN